MNDLIAWLTTNSTLMIRIGFTAILLLSVVYIYRHFFITKTTEVGGKKNTAAGSSEADANGDEASDTKGPSKTSAESAATDTTQLREKIEVLSKENSQLKNRVTEMQSELLHTQKKLEQSAEVASATKTEGSAEAGEESDGSDLSEMRKKMEQLESRLAEYEIIAEDISEIGQLRQENADLKQQLAGSIPATEFEPEPEIQIEPELSSDQLLDEMLAESESNRIQNEEVPAEELATEPESPSAVPTQSIKLISEKEVSKTEKELMTQFEETNRQKKGS